MPTQTPPFLSFVNQWDADISADYTCMQGSIQASLKQLFSIFGPSECIEHPSVRHHWRLRFGDGIVATIYSWGDTSHIGPDDVYDWRIGGVSGVAVSRVHQVFRDAMGFRLAA